MDICSLFRARDLAMTIAPWRAFGAAKVGRQIPTTKSAAYAAFLLKSGTICRIFRGAGDRMPTIRDFGGYKITLYAEDHNPPHVHVMGPDFQAKVRIADAAVFAGSIPPRHRREALAWVPANREALMEKWNELR